MDNLSTNRQRTTCIDFSFGRQKKGVKRTPAHLALYAPVLGAFFVTFRAPPHSLQMRASSSVSSPKNKQKVSAKYSTNGRITLRLHTWWTFQCGHCFCTSRGFGFRWHLLTSWRRLYYHAVFARRCSAIGQVTDHVHLQRDTRSK
jgi:hypothetical protein